jgi:AraC-like DNA-binding protein
MTVVHRADDLPVAARADYWRHVIGETIVPVDPFGDPDQIRAGGVGAVQVGEVSASTPGGARRTPIHIRRSDPGLYKIDVLAQGDGVIEQNGREAALQPGDFTLVDLSRPALWRMAPARIVALTFPAEMLPLRRDDVARLTAVRIRGDRGTGALISSLARQLIDQLDHCGGPDGPRLGTAVLDLLTAGLAARLDRVREMQPQSRQRALLLRVQAFIEERLFDPGLTPGSVAAAHHISLRYLHKLFEPAQTTVADWIRRRRLERCRRDLLDPALRDEPVSAIGMRWGLTDAAHFSRLFRAAYGVPPAEYREGAHGRQAGSRPVRRQDRGQGILDHVLPLN